MTKLTNEGTGLAANESGSGKIDLAGDSTTMVSQPRRCWAYAMISRCSTPPPRYGSEAWTALTDGDVRKVAGVVIAAEQWAIDGDNLESKLRAELDNVRRAVKEALDAEYVDRRDSHRDNWTGKAFRPSETIASEVEAEFCEWLEDDE